MPFFFLFVIDQDLLGNYNEIMKMMILCGMICSGKTTYTKNAAKNGMICINDDSIVSMLHGNDYTLYNKEFKILYKTIENSIISIALAMKKTVLIDRGLNISIEGRNRWVALARSFDIPCEAIVFQNEGPEIHAKRRFQTDSRGYDFEYWLKVANNHQDKYEIPTLKEGFSKIHFITFDEIREGKII